MGDYANRIMHKLAAKDPGEPESIGGPRGCRVGRAGPGAEARYMDARIFERIVEPERGVMFPVPWSTTPATSR